MVEKPTAQDSVAAAPADGDTVTCVRCGASRPKGVEKCPNCGDKVECPRCHTLRPEGEAKCLHCGFVAPS